MWSGRGKKRILSVWTQEAVNETLPTKNEVRALAGQRTYGPHCSSGTMIGQAWHATGCWQDSAKIVQCCDWHRAGLQVLQGICDMLVITRRQRQLSSNAAEPALHTIVAAFIKKGSCNFCRTSVCIFVLSTSSYDKTNLAALCVVDLFSLCHWAMPAKYSIYVIYKMNIFEWRRWSRWWRRHYEWWLGALSIGPSIFENVCI